MARDYMVGAVGKTRNTIVSRQHVGNGKHDRERRRTFHVFKEMRGVGREHDPSSPRSYTNALQAHRVAAKQVHGDTRGDFSIAVMKHDSSLECLSDEVAHMVWSVCRGERRTRHVRARCKAHLALLQVEVGLAEMFDRAGMIVMKVRDDDVANLGTVDPEHRQSVPGRPVHGPVASPAFGLVKADVHHN